VKVKEKQDKLETSRHNFAK